MPIRRNWRSGNLNNFLDDMAQNIWKKWWKWVSEMFTTIFNWITYRCKLQESNRPQTRGQGCSKRMQHFCPHLWRKQSLFLVHCCKKKSFNLANTEQKLRLYHKSYFFAKCIVSSRVQFSTLHFFVHESATTFDLCRQWTFRTFTFMTNFLKNKNC